MEFIRGVARSLKRLVLGEGESLEQKRSLTRLQCRIPVRCQGENLGFDALAVDIGLQGMRLEVPQKLPNDTVLAVSYHSLGRRRAPEKVVTQVRWCRKCATSNSHEVGLEYVGGDSNHPRSWVDYVLDEVGYDEESVFERRRSLRAPGKLLGYLVTKGGRYAGRVANLGIGGALLETTRALARGTPVEVEIGPEHGLTRLVMSGKVRHVRRAEAEGWLNGVVFEELRPEQVELLGHYLFWLMREAYR